MFACSHCDTQTLKWSGRCAECGQWGTLSDAGDVAPASGRDRSRPVHGVAPAATIGFDAIKRAEKPHTATGIEELDRVLGGGLTEGQVILLSGEPGIGKSTLLSSLAARVASCLYVAGEESPSQLKIRFERLGLSPKQLKMITATDAESITAAIKKEQPSLVIVDSIQTMTTREYDAAAGAPTHLRAATAQLSVIAKETGTPVILVGQVTKDGTVAGPKMLEHMVDTVLSLEGDPRQAYRLLRASKHRFGSTDEVGVFEMTSRGLQGVASPSALFVGTHAPTPGSALTCTMEGSRAFLVEIQALANASSYATPVRRASGFSTNRLQMLLAILERHGKMGFAGQDVYVNVVGGMTLREPSVDLAVCAALVSTKKDVTIPAATVWFGEVGLGGEIRPVPLQERRTKEATRLGMKTVLHAAKLKTVADLIAHLS